MKFVVTKISLSDFKIGFLSCANFMNLACWQNLTHLIIEDFLNIQLVDGKVRVAGEADRFGWREYKKILNQLAGKWPHLTILVEFHETVGRDILYGKLKFPCCDIEDFLRLNFPERNVGLCLRVLFGMSVINLDRGLGNALQCFRTQNDRQVWLNVENRHFVLNHDDALLFDYIVRYVAAGGGGRGPSKMILKVDDEHEARLAFAGNYAGMMPSIPIFRDRPDALILPTMQGGKSLFARCLQVWAQLDRCEECPGCDAQGSICAAQCNAPGSCSRQIGRDVPDLTTEDDDALSIELDQLASDSRPRAPEPLGQLFWMDDLQ